MRFKQMKLINFRQFKGENCLKFSLDDSKNVTLVLGNNGAGKTTLLQAFNWCLYDRANLDNQQPIINKEVLSELNDGDTAIVEVEVILEHLDIEYKCRNYIVYEKGTGGGPFQSEKNQEFTFVDSDGQTRKAGKSFIREIFPSDLSYYFLFDGERMQELGNNDSRGRKDLSYAVKNLMGLEMLETAKTHLKKVKREYESALVSDDTKRLDEINSTIKDLADKVEREKEAKKKYEDEKEALEKKFREVNEFLKSKAILKELQVKREKYDEQLSALDASMEEKKKEMFSLFGAKSSRFFCGEVLMDLRKKLQMSNLKDKGIEGINGNAISQILKNGKCICGADLNNNYTARENLENLRKYLPPESFATLLKALEITMDNTERDNKEFYKSFKKMYDDYNKLQSNKDTIQNERNENEAAIKEIGDQDLAEKNGEYLELRAQISSKDQAIGSCKTSIEQLEQAIRNRESERTTIATNSEVNKKILRRSGMCQRLIDRIDKELKSKEMEVRDGLQEKTSSLLGRMLRSDKKIVIGEDYNFSVFDSFGPSVLSEGEKIVTSFAFVGSLISVAKKVMNKKDKIDEGNDSKFTLAMDAPFAKLDFGHRKSVTEEIPRLTDQIILFTTDSQYDDEVRTSLRDRIFNSYEIMQNDSKDISFIKENA